MGLLDRWDAHNRSALGSLAERHGSLRRLAVLRWFELAGWIGFPVLLAVFTDAQTLAWYLVMASPFFLWSARDWWRRPRGVDAPGRVTDGRQ